MFVLGEKEYLEVRHDRFTRKCFPVVGLNEFVTCTLSGALNSLPAYKMDKCIFQVDPTCLWTRLVLLATQVHGWFPSQPGWSWLHTAVHPSEKEDSSVFPMKLPKPHTWLPSPSSAPNISWQMGVSQKWSHSIHFRKTSEKSLFCSPFKRPHPPGGMPAVHATTRSLMGIPASANANVAWARLETRCTERELLGFPWCPCLPMTRMTTLGPESF
jgi:hypothetical protein